jgi:hypothetical protein
MASLTPQAFVNKWQSNIQKERSTAQEHFIDLCRLIDHPTPNEADPTGERFTIEAAKELVAKRDAWLNPPGLNEAELKKRTLTNLYNQRPTWLDLAHKKLDAAVFAAYGWPADLSDEEILERLLALNLERAGSHSAPNPPSEPVNRDEDV